MADVDGSSLLVEAHILQCKTIELSIHFKMETVRRSFAVVIAFPQLKCMNVAASKNSSRARA